MRSQPIRAAVVGSGLMGHWHADAIRNAGGTVTWVVDPDEIRAGTLALRLKTARTATNLYAAISGGDVDVVHVCTPLASHVTLATIALDAGVDVLVEKPLAATHEETAQLLNLAAKNGRLLCPVHQFLFQPGVLHMLASIESLGELLHIDSVACSAGAVGSLQDEPDLLISEILPHPLSLLARISRRSVADLTWRIEHPRAGELRASACTQRTSLSLLISAQGRPTANSLRLVGSLATAHIDLFHGFAVVEGGGVSRWRKILHPFSLSLQTLAAAGVNLGQRFIEREAAYPGLRELTKRFYAAVRHEGPVPVSNDEALDVALARDILLGTLDRQASQFYG